MEYLRGSGANERQGKMIKSVQPVGSIPAPNLPIPIKTNLFFDYHGQRVSSWSYFARNVDDGYRNACVSSIAAGGGNAVIALMSNTDRNAPVSFFKDCWGGTADMVQLTILEETAKMIHWAGGSFWPVFFCDEAENGAIRNQPMAVHERAFSLLIAHLRPYVSGFCIGLESNEYFDRNRHNEFVRLIKKYAPDRYVLSHLQAIPGGGMPDIDAVFWEARWNTTVSITPSDLVSQAQKAKRDMGKIILPCEYDLRPNARQSQALLNAGFIGVGGPV